MPHAGLVPGAGLQPPPVAGVLRGPAPGCPVREVPRRQGARRTGPDRRARGRLDVQEPADRVCDVPPGCAPRAGGHGVRGMPSRRRRKVCSREVQPRQGGVQADRPPRDGRVPEVPQARDGRLPRRRRNGRAAERPRHGVRVLPPGPAPRPARRSLRVVPHARVVQGRVLQARQPGDILPREARDAALFRLSQAYGGGLSGRTRDDGPVQGRDGLCVLPHRHPCRLDGFDVRGLPHA